VEEFQRPLADEGTPEQRLADRVQAANRRIYETAQTAHERAGMGTTLTAAYLDEADLAVAHVGDSRAYILRDGALTRLTQDHSLVEELVRRGKLTEEQAAEHPQRSIITRALGIETDVEVDTWTFPVRAGDVVLMCSDGLTSMIGEDQIAAALGSEPDLDRAGERLIAEANEVGVRIVRYAVVPVLDRPDEVLGLRQSDLASGDEVQVLSASGMFLEVLCPNGDQGWVHRTTLGHRGSMGLSGAGRLVMRQEADDVLTALLSARGLI